MLTDTMQKLATVQAAITRNRAMRESCVRFDAPAEALATLDERFIALENERRALMGELPQGNYEMIEAKQEAYRRLATAMVGE